MDIEIGQERTSTALFRLETRRTGSRSVILRQVSSLEAREPLAKILALYAALSAFAVTCREPDSNNAPAIPGATTSSSAPAPVVSTPPPASSPSARAVSRARRTVLIEAGDYEVGTSDGSTTPIHGLPAGRAALAVYEIDAAEVTVSDYAACVTANGCDQAGLSSGALCNWMKGGRDNHPINCVTFAQAEAYCAWEKKRLPTEQEWEVAARAGGVLRGLDYGEGFRERLCLGSESADDAEPGAGELWTCPVDRAPEPPSKNNVLDMMGNVSEWTTGRFCAHKAPHCAARVLRGAAWGSDLYDTYQNRWRAPGRGGIAEGRRFPAQIGFRCARSVTR